MEFLSEDFKLKKNMVDFDRISEMGGDSCFIPLNLNKIKKEVFKDIYNIGEISEIYIDATYDMSNILLMSCDIFGHTYKERSINKEEELKFVREIVEDL